MMQTVPGRYRPVYDLVGRIFYLVAIKHKSKVAPVAIFLGPTYPDG
jgi:hypothetical protein